MNKETYIKLPKITVSNLQDVVDFLDDNNIEYIEEYKENEQLDKYKEVLDKIKEYCKEVIEEHNNGEYNVSTVQLAIKEHKGNIENILKLLEEIE